MNLETVTVDGQAAMLAGYGDALAQVQSVRLRAAIVGRMAQIRSEQQRRTAGTAGRAARDDWSQLQAREPARGSCAGCRERLPTHGGLGLSTGLFCGVSRASLCQG